MIHERRIPQVYVTRPRFKAGSIKFTGNATWAFAEVNGAISGCSASGHFSESAASDTMTAACAGTTGVDAGAAIRVGAIGAVGATGMIGAIETAGVTGAGGAIGATGITGATGAIGATGGVGITGAAGAMDTIGATGAVGATGAIGTGGVTGRTGTVGIAGLVIVPLPTPLPLCGAETTLGVGVCRGGVAGGDGGTTGGDRN